MLAILVVGELHHRGAVASLLNRGLAEGLDEWVPHEYRAHRLAERARSLAVDYSHGRDTGEKGIIEEPVEPEQRLIHGEATQVDFVEMLRMGMVVHAVLLLGIRSIIAARPGSLPASEADDILYTHRKVLGEA